MIDHPRGIKVKIKYGYNASDFVIVDNMHDVAKAMYAKIEKIPVTLAGRMISGQEIKTIEPDVHSYTGWNRSYEAKDADDFKQIERDVPEIVEQLIQATGERVNQVVSGGEETLLAAPNLTPEHLLGTQTRQDSRDLPSLAREKAEDDSSTE